MLRNISEETKYNNRALCSKHSGNPAWREADMLVDKLDSVMNEICNFYTELTGFRYPAAIEHVRVVYSDEMKTKTEGQSPDYRKLINDIKTLLLGLDNLRLVYSNHPKYGYKIRMLQKLLSEAIEVASGASASKRDAEENLQSLSEFARTVEGCFKEVSFREEEFSEADKEVRECICKAKVLINKLMSHKYTMVVYGEYDSKSDIITLYINNIANGARLNNNEYEFLYSVLAHEAFHALHMKQTADCFENGIHRSVREYFSGEGLTSYSADRVKTIKESFAKYFELEWARRSGFKSYYDENSKFEGHCSAYPNWPYAGAKVILWKGNNFFRQLYLISLNSIYRTNGMVRAYKKLEESDV